MGKQKSYGLKEIEVGGHKDFQCARYRDRKNVTSSVWSFQEYHEVKFEVETIDGGIRVSRIS